MLEQVLNKIKKKRSNSRSDEAGLNVSSKIGPNFVKTCKTFTFNNEPTSQHDMFESELKRYSQQMLHKISFPPN